MKYYFLSFLNMEKTNKLKIKPVNNRLFFCLYLLMENFIQWRVTTPTEKGKKIKTYDKLKSAKVDFGKACKSCNLLEKIHKKATLEGRFTWDGNWIILQELEINNKWEKEKIGYDIL